MMATSAPSWQRCHSHSRQTAAAKAACSFSFTVGGAFFIVAFLLLQRSSGFVVVLEQGHGLHRYSSGVAGTPTRTTITTSTTATTRRRTDSLPAGAIIRRTTACHLFFRKTQQETDRSVIRRICEDLTCSASLCLPYETMLGIGSQSQSDSQQNEANTNERLTIRLAQPADLHVLADMCVQEYDSGPTAFPFNNLKLIPAWWDRQALYALVYWTTLVKSLQQNNSQHSSSCSSDHAVLVGCINDRVVSMVEVSQQPVVPNRNPPVYPLPLSLKRLYGKWFLSGQPKQQQQQEQVSLLQGWLCNLLVVPEYRGRGLSKVLVAACEGVARHEWQCTHIYLHCDADSRGEGRVPQQLYEQLQYQRVSSSCWDVKDQQQQQQQQQPWHRVSNTFSIPQDSTDKKHILPALTNGLVVVDGVPLLYLRKDLTSLQ